MGLKRNRICKSRQPLLLLLILSISAMVHAQQYFDKSKLQNPKKFGPEIKAKFKEEFVYEYKVTPGKHAIFLQNGLRSSQFVSPQLWTRIRDTVYPYRVDIVYSRYPVHDSIYHEIYPLLCNRLIHLFAMDPSLNDPDFSWRTILQTHIENDDQVNTLFHGVVIWYRTPEEEAALGEENDSATVSGVMGVKEKPVQGGYQEMVKTIESMKQTSMLTDSLKTILLKKPLDEQKQIIREHLKTESVKVSTIKLTERTPLEMHQFKRQVGEFLRNNPFSDSVVWKVMDRHPEWVDAVAINDWTGSMYGYGAQVVHWHLTHYKTSGIRFLTLFNDGDNKSNSSKVIGETGGIYSSDASDIPKILSLFNLVRINGSGGDIQENDIEAILESEKRFPDHKEIILIADNFACIRDIELATKIKKPVRIIVCGYYKNFGVNPHLAYLAKVTGGGLYTLGSDLENLRIEVNESGEVKTNKDNRFVISSLPCKPKPIYELKYAKESFVTYTHYDSALMDKNKVRQLDLSEQEWLVYPTGISKMKALLQLNLSHNQLKLIPASIKKLENLKDLNISHNTLSKLPGSFAELRFLEQVNLSHNQLIDLKEFYPSMFYVKKLDASNNQLSQAEAVNELKNVQYLNLSNNRISELPAEIHQLKKLIALDLSNNNLLYLPRTFGGLTKLEELNLENNQIGSLPPYLYRLRKLKTLNLAGNPLGEKEKERIRKELPLVEIIF